MAPQGSTERVRAALAAAGLPDTIRTMSASTRTAEEAAAACGCAVAQIVKSLVFRGTASGHVVLLLVSGANRVDAAAAETAAGEALERADPRLVREETGFAIGGVAPLGHLRAVPVLMDEDLLAFSQVWAAAGAPEAVFSVSPQALADASGARVVRLKA